MSINASRQRTLLFAGGILVAVLVTAIAFDLIRVPFALEAFSLAAAVIPAVVVLAGLILRYLRPPDDKYREPTLLELSAMFDGLYRKQEELRATLANVTSPLTDDEKANFKRTIASALVQEATTEQLQEAASRLTREKTQEFVASTANRNADVTLSRIHAAIPQSLRRANINLVIGIVTTFTGIAVLAYGVFLPLPALAAGDDATFAYIRQFAPRLSLAILIEVFAYFFLRLYKSDLDAVRYHQNEMTNVEVGRTGLVAAIMTDDKPTVAAIALHLSKTDRNTTTAMSTASPISRKEIASVLDMVKAAAALKPGGD